MQSRNVPFTRRWPFTSVRAGLRLLRQPSGDPTQARGDVPAPGESTQANPGRWILSGVAVMLATNGFLGDWNRTHLFNPRWTPHSKYHDALTLLLGAGLGGMSLRALWRKEPDLETAALLPAIFWASMAGSFAFPGAGSIAREFPDPADRVGLSKIHEGVISAGMLALTVAGYALSRRQAAPKLDATEG
jgi:hypothetical protein